MAEQDQTTGTSIIKECPKCSTKMKITAALHGKRIKCPGCSILLKISEDGDVSVPVMTTFINAKICPECSTRMRITENLHGKKIKCPKCTTLLQISDTGDVALAKSAEEEEPEEERPEEESDTQSQFTAGVPTDEDTQPEAPADDDDDDEQLTVGDDEEPEPPARKEEPVEQEAPVQKEEPVFQARQPEQKPVPEVKPEYKPFKEEISERAAFTQKETPAKKSNGLFYVSMIIALILLIITLIDVFANYNLITSPIYGSAVAAPVDNTGKIAKQKSEYEIAKEMADKSIKCFEKANAAKEDAGKWSEERAAILVDFNSAVTSYLKAQTMLYNVCVNNSEKEGFDKGNILANADDELVKAVNTCKAKYINARFDVDLNYIFMDTLVKNEIADCMTALDEYSDYIKGKSAEYKIDDLAVYENAFFEANSKRIVSMQILDKWLVEAGRIDALDTAYAKIKKVVKVAAEKYFVDAWTATLKYKEYLNHAIDSELMTNETVKSKYNTDEMDSFESRLQDLEIAVDRNLEAAAEIRSSIETLDTELGNGSGE